MPTINGYISEISHSNTYKVDFSAGYPVITADKDDTNKSVHNKDESIPQTPYFSSEQNNSDVTSQNSDIGVKDDTIENDDDEGEGIKRLSDED